MSLLLEILLVPVGFAVLIAIFAAIHTYFPDWRAGWYDDHDDF